MADELSLDFDPLHTLGFLAVDWVEAHCKVPGGVFEGEPLTYSGWQLEVTVNHYRIKPGSAANPQRLLAPFFYRRSVIVGPQKCGKSPWGASIILFEAVGPSQFDGWAVEGDEYRCADHGCPCGWEYEYAPGEAMGIPRRKVLFGVLAFAEDQVLTNIYEPMQTMISTGPLEHVIKVREGFLRLPNRGKIIPVTSAAKSKLGQPFTGSLGDESGLYTKLNRVLDTWQTIRRGVAGMQGRTIELTNPWDPMENSAAQQAFESRSKDIYRYYRTPPDGLDYKKKRDRSKIHEFVYGDSPWVDPKSAIDPEANELVETDPTQAERFFGNRLVQGLGAFMTEARWASAQCPQPADVQYVSLGFDGSVSGDWTAIRAETRDGFRFTPTYGPDNRPTYWNPAEWEGQVPRGEVRTTVAEIFEKYTVARFYCDPRHWESQIDEWKIEYGEDVVSEWPTNSISRMYPALTRYQADLNEGKTSHDACLPTKTHALNARKIAKPGDKFLIGKPSEHQKIDLLVTDVIAHEAASDARANGWADLSPTYFRLPR